MSGSATAAVTIASTPLEDGETRRYGRLVPISRVFADLIPKLAARVRDDER